MGIGEGIILPLSNPYKKKKSKSQLEKDALLKTAKKAGLKPLKGGKK